MNIKCVPGSLLLCGLFFFSNVVFSNTLDQQRQDFLLAERLVEQDNEGAFLTLSSTLADYPLYPYLQYQWLKNHLPQTDKILVFLSAYKDTRYADLLRSKWLEYLGNNERWVEFIHYYQASDNAALECQFYWANYKVGNQQLALTEAKRLWVIGDAQPKECDSLLMALALSPVLTPDLIWQRFELALKKDNRPLAGYVQHLLNKPDQDVAEVWLQVHNRPTLIQDSLFLGGNERQGHIFAHGVDRMAQSDLDLAINIWDSRKHDLVIDNQIVQQLERRLALALARARDNRAYDRLNQLVAVDPEVREWKVRVALLEQNWQHVAHALTGLTMEEQQEPQWQYWQARSLVETGNVPQGQFIYNRLSENRSYYGFMAADAVNKPYSFADKPVFVDGNALETLAQKTDFKVIQELAILNRDAEAKRQWWFAVKKLPKEQLMIAAKLAQQWQWDQVAIITLVKADYWDDLALRFPVNYLSQVQSNAYWQNLDPAIIFGLIRQESMLDKNAQSAVGARGLMQIMPETGQQIARNLNEPWQAENSLFNPDVNIKYGAFYYKQLLNRFDGDFALATAAYNAGPNRVVKWLPNDRSVPADVWIETIPYKETRKYVTSVLSYAIIYQQRLRGNTLKIAKLLFDVGTH
ncbi:MAG: transglycosylase SLT domain-containing protein [Methylococcaceae bacterium]|nr:transglycosylase SLT domain-containing protein [Methylococcaceae bacterium]